MYKFEKKDAEETAAAKVIQSLQKRDYLKRFQEENPVNELFGEGTKELGNKVISLMKKGDITYEQADACLQYVYNKLKFESNFLKI